MPVKSNTGNIVASALKKASIQMWSMQKIINAISVIAFVLVAALTGGTLFGYLWITNEENQEKIKQQIIESVMSNVPIPGGITGPALPTKSPGSTGSGKPKLPF